MRFQVNAIFAVHSRKGLVFGSTQWVTFDEICFQVDAEIDPTETIDWRMELTGLPETVMGTLRVERHKPTDAEPPRNIRNAVPIYVAKIATMSDADRALFQTWLEDRSGSKQPRKEESSSIVRSRDVKSIGPKAKPESKSIAPEPAAAATPSVDSRVDRYGVSDRSSHRRSSVGRQAIRDALRASLAGTPKTETPAVSARDRRGRSLDWLEDTLDETNPPWLQEVRRERQARALPETAPEAGPSRPSRRSRTVDDDASKKAPPEYELPPADSDLGGFRPMVRDQAPISLDTTVPMERPHKLRRPAEPPPPIRETDRELTPVLPPSAVIEEDAKTVRPSLPNRPVGVTPPRSTPAPAQRANALFRSQPPPPGAPVQPDTGGFGGVPAPPVPTDLPGRSVSVLPKSRPPQVTVHYRDKAMFVLDYDKHLRGDGMVIQLPDLDTQGMRAFIRLVLPSGKDVRCRAEVVALLPDGAGVQLELRQEDKDLLKAEVDG